MSKILHTYQNGNCHITIKDDGTKIREWTGEPKPLFPESIDLKITDYCNGGCVQCHEMSSVSGSHANLDKILHFIDKLSPGVEVALGGGNPLSHPYIKEIVGYAKEKGIIPNLTVHSQHVGQHHNLICLLRQIGLKGLGISYDEEYEFNIRAIQDPNTVIHAIAGWDIISSLFNFLEREDKLLVLGYKVVGRGLQYLQNVVNEQKLNNGLREWRFWLNTLMNRCQCSFDNLAISQLLPQRFFSTEEWEKLYMGDDGDFTMYVDLVSNLYATSSISFGSQIPPNYSIEDLFLFQKEEQC